MSKLEERFDELLAKFREKGVSRDKITDDLDYNRGYLSQAKSRKQINEKLLQKLETYYNGLSKNGKQGNIAKRKLADDGIEYQVNSKHDFSSETVFNIAESQRILAEANKIQSEANKIQNQANLTLAEANRELVTMVTGHVSSGMPAAVQEMFDSFAKILAKVAVGKNNFHSEEEALTFLQQQLNAHARVNAGNS